MENVISSIISFSLFIGVLGLLVLIHELGHYIAARIIKAKVEEFAIGLGPKIWSMKKGETEYKINILPLGGYVKILGEGDDTDNSNPRNLKNKRPIERVFVMVAGVVMNFFLAALLYFTLFFQTDFKFYLPDANSDFKPVGGRVVVEKLSDKIEYSSLVDNLGAKNSGMPSKGEIKSVNNKDLEYTYELPKLLSDFKGQKVIINVCDTECKDYNVNVNSDGRIGISMIPNYVFAVSYKENFIFSGFSHSANMLRLMFSTLGDVFENAKSTGDYSQAVNSLSGPVGIYLAVDYVKQFGLASVLGLTADLSLVLAFMNLLPIPALDGGRILLTLPELITGKKINSKLENVLVNVSFILLLVLMFAIIVKDIVFFDSMKELFK